MRIKKISQDEVMVFLTRKDLDYFDFNPAGDIPKSADLHKLLFEVMELVQTETGFDPYHGGQVVVEASLSPTGLNLAISKLGTKKPMTREEFKNVKSVRVKQKHGMDSLSHRDILDLIESLGIEYAIKEKRRERALRNESFFFSEFRNLEHALSLMPDSVIERCALYRDKGEYALLTDLKKGSKHSNLLSEFADRSCALEMVEADIREGWKPVAEGEALVGMAGAIRGML